VKITLAEDREKDLVKAKAALRLSLSVMKNNNGCPYAYVKKSTNEDDSFRTKRLNCSKPAGHNCADCRVEFFTKDKYYKDGDPLLKFSAEEST